jgi:hypothetical protein
MSTRWLRHKPSGELYRYDPVFAANPVFEDYDPNPQPAPAIEEEPKKAPQKRAKKTAIPEDPLAFLGE